VTRRLAILTLAVFCGTLAAQEPPPPPPPVPIPDEAAYTADAYISLTKDGYKIEADCHAWGKVDAKTKYFVSVIAVASDSSDSESLKSYADGEWYRYFPVPYNGGEVGMGWWYQTIKSDGSDHLGNRIATDYGCWIRTTLWKNVDQGGGNAAISMVRDNWYWAPLLSP